MTNNVLSHSVDEVIQERNKRMDNYSYKLQTSGYGLDVQFGQHFDINENEMSVTIPFADGNRRDGVGDLLEVGGIDTERHRKNPIFLFDHGKQISLPVGKTEDPKTGEYTVFLDPQSKVASCKAFFYQGGSSYEHGLFCEQLFDLIAKKFIRAGSIGYLVKMAQKLPPQYETGTPQGLHLLSTLMLEASTVVLPANQDTIRKALCLSESCGKPLSPYLIKSLASYVDEAQCKVISGYEFKAKQRPQHRFAPQFAHHMNVENSKPVYPHTIHDTTEEQDLMNRYKEADDVASGRPAWDQPHAGEIEDEEKGNLRKRVKATGNERFAEAREMADQDLLDQYGYDPRGSDSSRQELRQNYQKLSGTLKKKRESGQMTGEDWKQDRELANKWEDDHEYHEALGRQNEAAQARLRHGEREGHSDRVSEHYRDLTETDKRTGTYGQSESGDQKSYFPRASKGLRQKYLSKATNLPFDPNRSSREYDEAADHAQSLARHRLGDRLRQHESGSQPAIDRVEREARVRDENQHMIAGPHSSDALGDHPASEHELRTRRSRQSRDAEKQSKERSEQVAKTEEAEHRQREENPVIPKLKRERSKTRDEKALKKDKVAEQQIEDQRRRMHIDRRLNTPDFDKARLTENSKRTIYGPGGKPTNTPPDPVVFQDQVNDQMRTSGAFDMEPEEPEEKYLSKSTGNERVIEASEDTDEEIVTRAGYNPAHTRNSRDEIYENYRKPAVDARRRMSEENRDQTNDEIEKRRDQFDSAMDRQRAGEQQNEAARGELLTTTDRDRQRILERNYRDKEKLERKLGVYGIPDEEKSIQASPGQPYKTNLPPARWRPGAGAIKALRRKYRTKSSDQPWHVLGALTKPRDTSDIGISIADEHARHEGKEKEQNERMRDDQDKQTMKRQEELWGESGVHKKSADSDRRIRAAKLVEDEENWMKGQEELNREHGVDPVQERRIRQESARYREMRERQAIDPNSNESAFSNRIKSLRSKYRVKSGREEMGYGRLSKVASDEARMMNHYNQLAAELGDNEARSQFASENPESFRSGPERDAALRLRERQNIESQRRRKSSDDIDNLPDEYTERELEDLRATNERNRRYDRSDMTYHAANEGESIANSTMNAVVSSRARRQHHKKDIQMGQSPQIGQRVTAKVPIVRRPPGAVPGPPEYLKDPLTTVGPSDQQGIKIQDSVGRMANVIVNDEIAVEAPRKKLRGLQAKYLKKAADSKREQYETSRKIQEELDRDTEDLKKVTGDNSEGMEVIHWPPMGMVQTDRNREKNFNTRDSRVDDDSLNQIEDQNYHAASERERFAAERDIDKKYRSREQDGRKYREQMIHATDGPASVSQADNLMYLRRSEDNLGRQLSSAEKEARSEIAARTRQRMQKPPEGKSVSGYQVKSEPTDEQKRRAAERKRVNRSKQSEETHDYGSESVARKSSKDEEQAHREYAEQRGNRSKEPFPPSSVIPVNDRASHASRRGADPATVDQLRREEEHNIQLNVADHSRRELLRAELRDSKRDRDAARKRGEEYNGPDPNDEYERISQATHEMDAARLGRTQEANAQHERRRAEHLKQQNEGKSVSGYKVKSEPTDEQKRRAAERERVTNNTESEETHDYTRDSYSPKRSKDSYLSQSELDASGYTEYDDDDEIEDLEDETAVARENQNYRNEIGDASDHYNNVIHRTQRGGPYGIRTDSGESLRGWEEREQAGAELAQTMQRAEQNQRSSRERRYQQYQKQEAQRKDEEAQAQNARNSKFDFGKSLFQKTKELRSKYRVKSADSDTVFVSSHIRTKAKKKEPPSFTPKTTEELAQRRRLGLEHERHTEESGMWEGSRRFLAENPEYFRDPKKVTEASREYREVTGKRQPPRRSWEDFPEEDLPKTSQEEQKSFSKKTKGLRAKYKTQRYPNPSKIEPRKRADRAESRGAYPTAVAGQRAAGDQAEEAHEMLRKNPTSANLREYSGTMDAISDGDQNSRASSERIMNATPEQLERYQRQRYREDMEEQNR